MASCKLALAVIILVAMVIHQSEAQVGVNINNLVSKGHLAEFEKRMNAWIDMTVKNNKPKDGRTGATGQPGLAGLPGRGVMGATGATGRRGQNGQPGITGGTGFPGRYGATGFTGFTGRRGATGLFAGR